MRFITTKGKEEVLFASSGGLPAYWGIFLYAALCEATDSPSQRRNFFKPPGEYADGKA